MTIQILQAMNLVPPKFGWNPSPMIANIEGRAIQLSARGRSCTLRGRLLYSRDGDTEKLNGLAACGAENLSFGFRRKP